MSDHFSGPRAIAGPAADICDVYAFPSPQTPDAVVLVLTVYPEARLKERFSDSITYAFRLRRARLPRFGTQIDVVDHEMEVAFEVTFDPSDLQTGQCMTSLGGKVSFIVGDDTGGRGDGARVFAGVRSDPFFIDLPAFERCLKSGAISFAANGRNSLDGANVLAIVVEFDAALLAGTREDSIWAVAAETRVTGKVPIRIERVGRPEVKNFLLRPGDPLYGDIELRDLYNLEDPFHLGGAYRLAYHSRINTYLIMLDGLDSKADWALSDDKIHPLTDVFLRDRLIIDVSKPVTESSYFEIELSLVKGTDHETFGGRTLDQDVMDKFYSLLIAGATGAPISDGVDMPTKPSEPDFPYLASPNHGPRTSMGRIGSKIKHHTHSHSE